MISGEKRVCGGGGDSMSRESHQSLRTRSYPNQPTLPRKITILVQKVDGEISNQLIVLTDIIELAIV